MNISAEMLSPGWIGALEGSTSHPKSGAAGTSILPCLFRSSPLHKEQARMPALAGEAATRRDEDFTTIQV